jgi:hypothetical protein
MVGRPRYLTGQTPQHPTEGNKKLDFYLNWKYIEGVVQVHLDLDNAAHPPSGCLSSIDLEHHVLLSCRPFIFFTQLCASPWMVCGLIDLISSISSRTGPTVALPPTPAFCFGLGRTPQINAARLERLARQALTPAPVRAECAFTQQQARRVIDMTRDWLQTSPSPQKMC